MRGQKTALTRRGFFGGTGFLTLFAQWTRAAMANAGGIQHAQRAVALRPAFLQVQRMARWTHGLRNEMHFRLKELHRPVQCSRFLLARDQKYLCLLEAGESGRMLSSQIPDELKLVAHPVGWTAQRPIGLRGKGGTRKSMRKGGLREFGVITFFPPKIPAKLG